LITNPTLAQLMSLFIGWGLAILKQQWLEAGGVPLGPAKTGTKQLSAFFTPYAGALTVANRVKPLLFG
jgi:hypothetical protein